MRIEPEQTQTQQSVVKSENKNDSKKADMFDKMIGNDKEQGSEPNQKEEKVEPNKQQRELLLEAMKRNSKELPLELKGKTEIPADFKMDKKEMLALMKSISKEIEVPSKNKQEIVVDNKTVETPVRTREPIIPEVKKEAITPVNKETMPVKTGEIKNEKEPATSEKAGELVPKETSKEVKVSEKPPLPDVPLNPQTIKKEEKTEQLINKIKGDLDISPALKVKLIAMIENKKEPEKIIKELKTEITRIESQGVPIEIRDISGNTKIETKMEMKEWVDRIKTELKYMVDFRVESENKIKLNLSNEQGFIRLNIEKINNEFIIQSETSSSMRKRVDEILAEVRLEMREKNVDVKFEREKDTKDNKESKDEREENSERRERGEKDGSNNADEQRRRGK